MSEERVALLEAFCLQRGFWFNGAEGWWQHGDAVLTTAGNVVWVRGASTQLVVALRGEDFYVREV